MNNFTGNSIQVNTTHSKHFTSDMNTLAGSKNPDTDSKNDFFSILTDALGDVNAKQGQVSEMTQKMITNPEQVEIHDVMIALEKAKMALNLTRTIRDTAIKSYREITNLR